MGALEKPFVFWDIVPQFGFLESTFDIQPLSFDRVHEGHVTTSSFPLFRLPIELFSNVLNHLSSGDLKALALVDKDCQKIANLCLFKDVKLYYAPEKCSHCVLEDGRSTSHTTGHATSANAASYIRRLTITGISSTTKYSTLLAENDGRPADTMPPSLDHFRDSISTFLEKSLPNLRVLDWNATTPMSATLLSSILSSPVKHLQLKGVILEDDFVLSPVDSFMLLETLSLDFPLAAPSSKQMSMDIIAHIVHGASSTLRQLTWNGYLDNSQFLISNGVLLLPNLRSLSLDAVASNCDSILSLFVGANTRVATLALDSMTPSTCRFYRTRGRIPSLTRFSWLHHGDVSSFVDVSSFLEANPQLEALHIPDATLPQLLDEDILPMLATNFDALVSLHVVWDGPDLHEKSLNVIAQIRTLRHLWISVGDQKSIRNIWEIDHDAILEHLSPLVHLETLAFSKDSYVTDAHPLSPRFCDYYSSKALPIDFDIAKYLSPAQLAQYHGRDFDYAQQMEMRHLAWENLHASDMLDTANEYEGVFPALRWTFFGQLAMERSPPGRFSLMHEPPRREPCLSSLQKKMSMTIWRPI